MKPDRVVLEIELTGYNAEGIRETYDAVKDDMTLAECVEDVMGLWKDEVHVIALVAPPDKGMNYEAFVAALEGRVIGYRLVDGTSEDR